MLVVVGALIIYTDGCVEKRLGTARRQFPVIWLGSVSCEVLSQCGVNEVGLVLDAALFTSVHQLSVNIVF